MGLLGRAASRGDPFSPNSGRSEAHSWVEWGDITNPSLAAALLVARFTG